MRETLNSSAQDKRFLRPRPSLPSLLSARSAKSEASLVASPAGSRLRSVSSYSYLDDGEESTHADGRLHGEEREGFVASDGASVNSLNLDDAYATTSIPQDAKGKGKAAQVDPRDLLRQQLRKSEINQSRRSINGVSDGTTPSISPRTSVPSESLTLDNQKRFLPRSKRRYFVLSSAGKPVFASDDLEKGFEENATSSLVGVMQAIISIYADQNDRIRYITAGRMRIAIVIKQHLYYVAASDWGEPESVLRNQLDYLHWHILSIVSNTQLQRMFSGRDNFDLGRVLQGTDAIAVALLDRIQHNLAVITNTLSPLRLDTHLRQDLGKLMSNIPPDCKTDSNVLYAILLCGGKLVTLSRPRNQTVFPVDFHLLVNTIYSSPSLATPNNENWIPICLPRFNGSGFLHVLVSFVTKEVGIVIVSTDKEAFFPIREWKDSIATTLRSDNRLRALHQAALHSDYSPGDLSIPGLRHFMYYHKTLVQIACPRWEGLYDDIQHRRELITIYQRIYDQIHLPLPKHGQGRHPVKLVYLQTASESVIGYVQQHFELYVAVEPSLSREAVVNAAQCVARWVKHREAELFLVNAPCFA